MTKPAAQIWRPMANAPTDAPFIAKLRDDLTVTVDGSPQRSIWAGYRAVVQPEGDAIAISAPEEWLHHFFMPDEFEGWAPLPGERAR